MKALVVLSLLAIDAFRQAVLGLNRVVRKKAFKGAG